MREWIQVNLQTAALFNTLPKVTKLVVSKSDFKIHILSIIPCHLNNKSIIILKFNSCIILQLFSCIIAFQRKNLQDVSSLQYFYSRHLIWHPIFPSLGSQISDLGTLIGDPYCSNDIITEHEFTEGTGSRQPYEGNLGNITKPLDKLFKNKQ